MSTYYNYYLGYLKEGKIYPMGPFDYAGKLCSASSKSRSFADANLYDLFSPIPENMLSDELLKHLKNSQFSPLQYLPYEDLPIENPFKQGYFLISDVQAFERTQDSWDLFYDHLSPTVYAALMTNQQKGLIPTNRDEDDEDDEDDKPKQASDYMYYAYYDENCMGDELLKIRTVASMLNPYYFNIKAKDMVVILSAG